MRRGAYRSPRNARRFRVLLDENDPDTPTFPPDLVLVCEGLPKPRRGAHWRFVAAVERGPDATAAALVLTKRELGFALIPADCGELDFVRANGELVD